jgi:hypothetical protein
MPAISTLNSATTITDNTASTGTNSGALVILGGAGIAGDLYVGATVSVASTAQSTSTTTGALVVAGGVGIGKDLFVGGNINVSGSINLTGSSNFIDFTATTGTFQKVVITSTETSTSTTTGALVVRGGVGIQKDVWIGGRMYSESVQIADSIIDSTSIMVNTTNAIVVDSYSINEFRSSKYLVQIDDGTGLAANFQLIEILLLVDNAGTVYATEYGTLTSNGGLGEFAADVQGDNILRLYFTPYTASSKTIKVLRTAITV